MYLLEYILNFWHKTGFDIDKYKRVFVVVIYSEMLCCASNSSNLLILALAPSSSSCNWAADFIATELGLEAPPPKGELAPDGSPEGLGFGLPRDR